MFSGVIMLQEFKFTEYNSWPIGRIFYLGAEVATSIGVKRLEQLINGKWIQIHNIKPQPGDIYRLYDYNCIGEWSIESIQQGNKSFILTNSYGRQTTVEYKKEYAVCKKTASYPPVPGVVGINIWSTLPGI